jgi:hypothetical protein
MLEQERNILFSEEKRRKESNPEAHPLSGMLIFFSFYQQIYLFITP